jgi:nucleoside-diphosphate-sugar epimerase
MLSGKTFLITGATGRLGCATVHRLEELGAAVFPLVLNRYPLEPKRVQWPGKASPIVINKLDDLKRLQAPDFVINFHWRIDRTLPATTQLLYEIDNNVHKLGFFWNWLLDKSFQSIVNISSIKVFSHLNQNPISAETEPRPITPYGIAKLTAEKYFDAHFSNSLLRVTHLRLCYVASYGEHPSHLMSQLYSSAFHNKLIKIHAGVTSIMYIEHVIDLIINAAIACKKNRYIIAPSSESNHDIARIFEKVVGRSINAYYNNAQRKMKDPIYISDIEELQASWTRSISLEEMIKRLVELHR